MFIVFLVSSGYIEFSVEYRAFDYGVYYDDWRGKSVAHNDDGAPISRQTASVESIFPREPVLFPTHRRNFGTDWHEWWHDHKKIAKLAK